MPLDDINYAVITSTFYFMNARAMQAAKDPPKAKSEGHTKDYKRPRLKLPPQSPVCRATLSPCYFAPWSSETCSISHAVNHCDGDI